MKNHNFFIVLYCFATLHLPACRKSGGGGEDAAADQTDQSVQTDQSAAESLSTSYFREYIRIDNHAHYFISNKKFISEGLGADIASGGIGASSGSVVYADQAGQYQLDYSTDLKNISVTESTGDVEYHLVRLGIDDASVDGRIMEINNGFALDLSEMGAHFIA